MKFSNNYHKFLRGASNSSSKQEFLVELLKASKSTSNSSLLFDLWITWEVKWEGIMENHNSHFFFFIIKTQLQVFFHTQKWKIHFYSFLRVNKISEKPRPCDWESLNCWEYDQVNTEGSKIEWLDHNFSAERQVWNVKTALPIVNIPKHFNWKAIHYNGVVAPKLPLQPLDLASLSADH